MGGRSSGESVLELSHFERHLQSFDVAWSNRTPPKVAEFLSAIEMPALDALREKLLWELIAIDMEHRWRCRKPMPVGDELGCRQETRHPLARNTETTTQKKDTHLPET